MRTTGAMKRVLLTIFLVTAFTTSSVRSSTSAPAASSATDNVATTTVPPTTGASTSETITTTVEPTTVALNSAEPITTTTQTDPTTVQSSMTTSMAGGTQPASVTPTSTVTTESPTTVASTDAVTTTPASSDTTTPGAVTDTTATSTATGSTSVETGSTTSVYTGSTTSVDTGSTTIVSTGPTVTVSTGTGSTVTGPTDTGSTTVMSTDTTTPPDGSTTASTAAPGTTGPSVTEPTTPSPTTPTAPTQEGSVTTPTEASTASTPMTETSTTLAPTTTTPGPNVKPEGEFVLKIPFSCTSCTFEGIKQKIRQAFEVIPGFLYIRKEMAQRMKRDTSFVVGVVFGSSGLMSLNETMRKDELSKALKGLVGGDGVSFNETVAEQMAADFAELTSNLCNANKPCDAQYMCDEAKQECVPLCAPFGDCSGHGTCKVEIVGTVAAKAVCVCDSDNEKTYTGDKCQDSETSKTKVVAILGGVLGTICAILLIIVIVMICKQRGGNGSKYELGGRGYSNSAYSDDVNMKKMG